MLTNSGHLTYCTNIHSGESWRDHFIEMKKNIPGIKKKLSPDNDMGIGLRLSNVASIELSEEKKLAVFMKWLHENHTYVFTMNGFPYGSFHNTRVKDQVHAPDWTTRERVDYTLRLFEILKTLLPEGMDGGISTSPLSYRHWFKQEETLKMAIKHSTSNIVLVVIRLIEIHQLTGKVLHLDIEPEPDGMLESGKEFILWFKESLLVAGAKQLADKLNVSMLQAEEFLKLHVRLCYDVCHFAIGFEPHKEIIDEALNAGIKIGKVQISAALKGKMNDDISQRQAMRDNFSKYNEPTYLHQVVAQKKGGDLLRYSDLPEALSDYDNPGVLEWRAHFHVPIFEQNFESLQSTQDDIEEVLLLQKELNFTNHLEVETYTWEVLPGSLKLPIQDSVIRELQWVLTHL